MPQDRYFRLYIDESGDHTFQLVENDNHRYLGLLGIWFDAGEPYSSFVRSLLVFKREIFAPHPDDDPICLHRKDIVERRGIFGRLRDGALNERFESGLSRIIENAEFCMTCVVLDKARHSTKTYRELFHPYHYCIAVLLERYASWLESVGAQGDVMAESRGRKEDEQLRQAFEQTLESGTRYHSSERFQRVFTSTKLKLKKKEHDIAGLQLADLLAYPFKREMIAESRSKSPPQDFSSRLLNVARPKIHCHPSSRRVPGYGKVWLS